MKKFKLPDIIDILGCELYAIKVALQFILTNCQELNYRSYVIYTDSQSSIKNISNRNPKGETRLIFQIQDLLFVLRDFVQVKIQFVPGHKNIYGNELADLTANAGHANNITERYAYSKNTIKKQINSKIQDKWQQQWINKVNLTKKGNHITTVRDKVGPWPWAHHKKRVVETVFAKLRIGHVNLKQHLFRFGLSDSPLCSCGEMETVAHIFIDCPIYDEKVIELQQQLTQIGVPLTVKNLLGGGNFPLPKQLLIINIAAEYLQNIGKLYRL